MASGRDPSRRLLVVGNFLSASLGTRGVCEDLADLLERSGWSVVRASDRLPRSSRLAHMAWTALTRRRDYDIVLIDVFSGPAFFWAAAVSLVVAMLHVPYILTLHGGNLPTFSKRIPWLVRHVLSHAAAVTAPSAYLAGAMHAFRSDVAVIPNPLSISRYRFSPRVQPAPTLIWLRAFHKIYAPTLAPHVLRLILDDFPDARLIMIGPDKDGSRAETLRTAEALGVSAALELVGAIAKDDVPDALARGDVFLNTTTVDNTPVSVIEAMACGLCIVSTEVGGIPHLLLNEENALLAPPGDAVALAHAVARVLTEPGLASKLSLNARRTAEQSDWPVVLQQWEELLATKARRASGSRSGGPL